MRPGPDGLEVAVVHRAKRQDWSFPKGHLEAGESAAEAALREVEEESGMWCRLGAELGRVAYVDHRGEPKVVDYWAMTVEAGEFVRNDEVDELRWLSFPAAAELLTYPTDREVLGRLRAVLDAPPA